MGKLSCSKTDMYRGPSTSGVCQFNHKKHCVGTCLLMCTSRSLMSLCYRLYILGNTA